MAILTILAPPGAGLTCEIPPSGSLLLGRDSRCDVVLGQRALSRRHAKVIAAEGEFLLEDLQSTNGTYLNGRRIHGSSRLQDGDVINLYDVPLAFTLDASDAQPSGDDTFKFPASELLAGQETVASLPVYPGTPGARILQGRLNSLVEIVRQLGSELDPQLLPPRVLDLLFRMFPQAERGEVLLVDDRDRLSVVAARHGNISASAIGRRDQLDVCDLARTVWETGHGVMQSARPSDGDASILYEESTACICMPIVGVTTAGLGVILLETSDLSHTFSHEDLELAGAVGVLAGQALEFTRAHQILRESDQTQHHLQTAHAIQIGMLPRQTPVLAGYEFADFYSPAQAVGGDYYFYEQLGNDRVLLGIADASGKGLGAAMTIARFAGEVRARLITARTLKQAMFDLNRFVLDCGTATFITCCVCVLDARTHKATIASAGHLPPLCHRSRLGTIEEWSHPGGGLPFGIDPDFVCHPVKYQLEPGDSLLMYTDGASEAMNPDDELFGQQRLEDELRSSRGDVRAMVEHIVRGVDRFRAGRIPSDDICLLAAQRLTD